jgi:hypothetical protein
MIETFKRLLKDILRFNSLLAKDLACVFFKETFYHCFQSCNLNIISQNEFDSGRKQGFLPVLNIKDCLILNVAVTSTFDLIYFYI